MSYKFKICAPTGERWIGENCPCFIVAELSANHGQDLNKAKEIIRQSAAAGADAIKLQTYLPSTMTLDCDNEHFLVAGETGPDDWKNKTLYQLYQQAYTPWEWHPILQKLTEELGMIFFSTPFDATAVDFLESLNVPLYKIASYELTDVLLLEKVAKTKKPVIISIGFGDLDEVTMALETLRRHGAKDIAILHCVTNYSKEPDLKHTNLSTIRDLEKRFGTVTGFSDNTGGIEIPLQAVMVGAAVIEKHIIVREGDKSLDAKFSLEPNEFKLLVTKVREFETAYGKPVYGPRNQNENYFKNFRRSIFASCDIKKGERLTAKNMRVVRPSHGLAPRYWDQVVNKKAVVDIKMGTPMTWEGFE